MQSEVKVMMMQKNVKHAIKAHFGDSEEGIRLLHEALRFDDPGDSLSESGTFQSEK